MMSPVNTARKPQEAVVKCPRCDSPNTKFCYYNNYSLTQPRHFCKTCRRYWTKGGALRNVPIGGGCRKNKKSKSSSAEADVGAFKFFQGISPAMDFQLGAINNTPRFSNTDDIFNHFSSLGNFNLESSGISSAVSFPLSSRNGALGFQEMGSMNIHSSIESLSSINQDLHWKLQQQRFASLLAEDNHKENSIQPFVQKPQPILFQNLENSKTFVAAAGSSRKDGGNGNGNLSTELFFNSSYATVAPATSSTNNWSGINQAWTELTHFTSLP